MIHSVPILYSFRRCPYAMRARLGLHVSDISCELREVVLRDKPTSMLQASPKGTVPVLVLPEGEVIDESLSIMLWALVSSDPQCWLKPDRDEMLHLIEMNDSQFKGHLDRYKYADRYEGVDALEERALAEKFIQLLEERLSQSAYLLGQNPSLADYAILPFIRQFAFVDKSWFDQADYIRVQTWLENFLRSSFLQAVMEKYPKWQEGDAPLYWPQKKAAL